MIVLVNISKIVDNQQWEVNGCFMFSTTVAIGFAGLYIDNQSVSYRGMNNVRILRIRLY